MQIIQFLSSCIFIFGSHFININLCEPFLEPIIISSYEESFILNDVEYIFTNQRVTWEEAKIACSLEELGSLAVINNTEKANFLASALAVVDFDVQIVWSGAYVQNCITECSNATSIKHCLADNTCFKWLTGEVVNSNFMVERRSEASLTVRNCLSFARSNHSKPLFVDLACRLKRPYICQRQTYSNVESVEEDEGARMTHKEWIRIGKYEYAIFYEKKTWRESVRDCFSNHKAYLANFRNMREIDGIGKYLLVGKPSLKNAWIGGFLKQGEWRYISIDDTIPKKKNLNTLYPPWLKINSSLSEEGCLLLDRHLDDGKQLFFLPNRCEKKSSFICSRLVFGITPPSYEDIIIEEIFYRLFYIPKTWIDAYDTCKSENFILVEVTKDKLDKVLYIMGEKRTEINHIWIGGKLIRNSTWRWVTSNSTVDTAFFNDYPPWMDNFLYNVSYACLNLDRENHNVPIFYGTNCLEPQPFICEKYYNGTTTILPTTTTDLTTTPTTSSTTTTARSTTKPSHPDIWHWKWPVIKHEFDRIKPFFNWTNIKYS